jgi:hypothetical protein
VEDVRGQRHPPLREPRTRASVPSSRRSGGAFLDGHWANRPTYLRKSRRLWWSNGGSNAIPRPRRASSIALKIQAETPRKATPSSARFRRRWMSRQVRPERPRRLKERSSPRCRERSRLVGLTSSLSLRESSRRAASLGRAMSYGLMGRGERGAASASSVRLPRAANGLRSWRREGFVASALPRWTSRVQIPSPTPKS